MYFNTFLYLIDVRNLNDDKTHCYITRKLLTANRDIPSSIQLRMTEKITNIDKSVSGWVAKVNSKGNRSPNDSRRSP